jgi:serine/threonine protein kinase
MNAELTHISSQLSQATRPEDVFGDLGNNSSDLSAALRRIYHALAKSAHPDVYFAAEEKVLAQTTFGQLTHWFAEAEKKIKAGRYGRRENTVLQIGMHEYDLEGGFSEDETFNFYPCTLIERGTTRSAVLRIVRDPRNNTVAQNEVRILNLLLTGRDSEKFAPYLPTLLDSFLYEDGTVSRQAMIFEKYEGWYSLEDVQKEYPYGIDPRDMAWIWRRLLVILGFAHANRVIHGAVLPGNIWIQPEQHGLMLKNWFHSVHDPETTGEYIPKINPTFVAWYPEEVLRYEMPTFGVDIQMSAKCMIHLLGGDVKNKMIPDTVPYLMRQFLKGSILPGKRTPQDAWAVMQDFDDLLTRLWGARKFHPFKMSTPVG